jgi:hypothetical protein
MIAINIDLNHAEYSAQSFLVDISKFLIESSTFRSNVNGIWVDILRQYKLWISSGEINTEFQIFLNFSPEK